MTHSDSIRPEDEAHLQISRRDVIVGVAVVAACSGEDDAGSSSPSLEAKAPYPPWNPTLANGYWRTMPDGTTARYVTRESGKNTIKGRAFHRFAMTREGGTGATSAELWISSEGDKITLAGGSYTSESAAKLGIAGTGSVSLDEPITVDLGAPIGSPRSVELKGTIHVGSTTASVNVKGTYTVVERGVAVDTPAGVVVGCTHLSVKGGVPILFGVTEVSASGELWYSPTLGVVKAKFNEPLSGFGVGINGSRGSHDLGGGYASVEAVGVVGNGVNRFELSTTEASGGEFDADKTVHAKMLIEMRWVDEANARTDKQPLVNEELGTALGYFPSTLVKSPISFLHPDENDRGYTYWIAYADQAAKNEAGSNGIAYHTSATCDPSLSPVRVSSRIVYKRIVLAG